MQVPSTFLNPFMSWRMPWVDQPPESSRTWKWGAICQALSGTQLLPS